MEKSIENWKKSCKMAGHYEDLLICCEDKSDLCHIKKELSYWKSEVTKQARAIFKK